MFRHYERENDYRYNYIDDNLGPEGNSKFPFVKLVIWWVLGFVQCYYLKRKVNIYVAFFISIGF